MMQDTYTSSVSVQADTNCHTEKGQQASSGGGNGDIIIVASPARGVPREGALQRVREGYKPHGIRRI